MKKITRQKDHWGQDVIYVEKCTRYEYENPVQAKKTVSSLHNAENIRINDILYVLENYYSDS